MVVVVAVLRTTRQRPFQLLNPAVDHGFLVRARSLPVVVPVLQHEAGFGEKRDLRGDVQEHAEAAGLAVHKLEVVHGALAARRACCPGKPPQPSHAGVIRAAKAAFGRRVPIGEELHVRPDHVDLLPARLGRHARDVVEDGEGKAGDIRVARVVDHRASARPGGRADIDIPPRSRQEAVARREAVGLPPRQLNAPHVRLRLDRIQGGKERRVVGPAVRIHRDRLAREIHVRVGDRICRIRLPIGRPARGQFDHEKGRRVGAGAIGVRGLRHVGHVRAAHRLGNALHD